MKKIRNILLGSAASLIATGGLAITPATAADVKACDLYGSGFFYLPGTETCMKIGGRVRAQFQSRSDDSSTTNLTAAVTGTAPVVTAGTADTTAYSNDGRIQFDVRSESDVGTVRGVYRFTQGGSTDALRVHVGDNLTFGSYDDFATRFNGYGHPTIFDGLYGFSTSNYVEVSGSTGPVSVTVGTESGEINDEDANIYAGVRFDSSGLGNVSLYAVSHGDTKTTPGEDDTVIGVAAELSAVDNLFIKAWYQGDDGKTDTIAGTNETQWGIGGSYSFGDWTLAGGYSQATGGDTVAQVVGADLAANRSAVDPEVNDFTIQLGWSIAPGLKAELAYQDLDGAITATDVAAAAAVTNVSPEVTATKGSSDTGSQVIRLRVTRSW